MIAARIRRKIRRAADRNQIWLTMIAVLIYAATALWLAVAFLHAAAEQGAFHGLH